MVCTFYLDRDWRYKSNSFCMSNSARVLVRILELHETQRQKVLPRVVLPPFDTGRSCAKDSLFIVPQMKHPLANIALISALVRVETVAFLRARLRAAFARASFGLAARRLRSYANISVRCLAAHSLCSSYSLSRFLSVNRKRLTLRFTRPDSRFFSFSARICSALALSHCCFPARISARTAARYFRMILIVFSGFAARQSLARSIVFSRLARYQRRERSFCLAGSSFTSRFSYRSRSVENPMGKEFCRRVRGVPSGHHLGIVGICRGGLQVPFESQPFRLPTANV